MRCKSIFASYAQCFASPSRRDASNSNRISPHRAATAVPPTSAAPRAALPSCRIPTPACTARLPPRRAAECPPPFLPAERRTAGETRSSGEEDDEEGERQQLSPPRLAALGIRQRGGREEEGAPAAAGPRPAAARACPARSVRRRAHSHPTGRLEPREEVRHDGGLAQADDVLDRAEHAAEMPEREVKAIAAKGSRAPGRRKGDATVVGGAEVELSLGGELTTLLPIWEHSAAHALRRSRLSSVPLSNSTPSRAVGHPSQGRRGAAAGAELGHRHMATSPGAG